MRSNINIENLRQVVEYYFTDDNSDYILKRSSKGVATDVFQIIYKDEVFWLRIKPDLNAKEGFKNIRSYLLRFRWGVVVGGRCRGFDC